MKNFKSEGNNLDLTAPAGGVKSGALYILNGLAVVAKANAAAGKPFVGMRVGIFQLPKANAVAADQGAVAYWDASKNQAVAKAEGNQKIGVFPYGAQGGNNSADVLLTGQLVE